MYDKISRNSKKIIFAMVMIFGLLFIGTAVVMGDNSGSGDTGNGQGTSCSDCTCGYAKDGYSFGVRLSLVYWDTAERVEGTNSIDIFSSDSLPSGTSDYKNSIYIIPNDNEKKFNRFEMVEGIIPLISKDSNPQLQKTTWGTIKRYNTSSLGINKAVDIANGLNDYETFIDSLATQMSNEIKKYSETGDINDIRVTDNIFRALGLSNFRELSDEQLKNIHIAIEPVITARVYDTGNIGSWSIFYGTITQFAHAFQARICKDPKSADQKYSIGNTVLSNKFGVVLYAESNCNTVGDKKYCGLKEYPAVSKPENNKKCRLLGKSLSDRDNICGTEVKKQSYGVGYIWLGSLPPMSIDSCPDSVGYLNSLYKNGKITKSKYEEYIGKVIAGNFEIKNNSTEQVYKVTASQSWELLNKTNYERYNGGYAACSNIPKSSKNCDAALEYINSNYAQGTAAYHNAVEQVRNGTFSYDIYVDGILTKIQIDKAYNDREKYSMLFKDVYTKVGGEAKCEAVDVCLLYEGGVADVDSCVTGKTYFTDIDDSNVWLSCGISYTNNDKRYSSDNTGHAAVETTSGGVVGNKEYCELFCYETFETSFPTNVYDVKAGQIFNWGATTGLFGYTRITKTCSTQNYIEGKQGYQYDKWLSDYKKNEKALVKYLLNKVAYEKAIDSIYVAGFKCYTNKCTVTVNSKEIQEKYSHAFIGEVESDKIVAKTSMAWGATKEEAENAARESLKAKIGEEVDETFPEYSGAVLNRETLLNKIKQCTNNIAYGYNTDVRFKFSEPVNGVYGANSRSFSYDGNLIAEGSYNKNNVDTSRCTSKTVYAYTYSDDQEKVVAQSKKVLDCTMVSWNISGNYLYKYPTDEFVWYSLKTNGSLVNENDKGSEDEAFFYSVGFGLPTALSLTDGTYELKVTVSNVGDSAEIFGSQPNSNQNGHFANLAEQVSTLNGIGYGFDYTCIYEVENDIFGNECQYDSEGKLTSGSPAYCDPKKDGSSNGSLIGIDITYRLVTLLSDSDSIYKAFPGVDGNGRNPASNWNMPEESIKDILDENVYNTSQAMYEIMLDVNAIQQIRRDNQTYFDAGKDPYTSYTDANNNQKVYCKTGEEQQKYCASDFISELYLGNNLNYSLMGTCLPTSDTLKRAELVLKNGCNTYYDYPAINWTR